MTNRRKIEQALLESYKELFAECSNEELAVMVNRDMRCHVCPLDQTCALRRVIFEFTSCNDVLLDYINEGGKKDDK